MCGEYTDYTRSYHHPGSQFWVGSSRKGLAWDATRRLRFVDHAAGWLHSMVIHARRHPVVRCLLMYIFFMLAMFNTLDMQSRRTLPGFSTGFFFFFLKD